jgi:hypothetical protein
MTDTNNKVREHYSAAGSPSDRPNPVGARGRRA